MSFRALDVGMVRRWSGACRLPGDLGYEIWVTGDYQRALFDLLTQAGGRFGLRHFGGRALNAMRLEKSFGTGRAIPAHLRTVTRPVSTLRRSAQGRIHRPRGGTGWQVSGGERRLVTLDVAARDADAIGDEPIWYDGRVVGWSLGRLRAQRAQIARARLCGS